MSATRRRGAKRGGGKAARPFTKRPGGKAQLLAQYAPLLPTAAEIQGKGYREPAVGGGAVFFGLYASVRPARLSDIDADLIGLYVVVRDDVEALIAALAPHADAFGAAILEGNAAFALAIGAGVDLATAKERRGEPYRVAFTALRTRFNERGAVLSGVERAALTVALSKTCMNGLWRTNKTGKFNTSPGRQVNGDGSLRCPNICDAANLRACSSALQGVDLRVADMADSIANAAPGEFCFVDSPYVPVSKTACFTAYAAGDFDYQDQGRVAVAIREAAARGVKVAAANSDVPEARALYRGASIVRVMARRSINRDGAKRGPVGEILARTWL